MDLDLLRARLEQCNQEVAREDYLHASGQKSELAVAPILERYADTGTAEAAGAVKAAWLRASGEERTRLRFLYQNVAGNLLGRAVAPLHDAIGSQESSRTVLFEGQEIPLPAAQVRVANEPDRERRHALEDARLWVVEEMNPLYRQAHVATSDTIARSLDSDGYTAFYQTTKAIDFRQMAEMLERFLEETRDLYFQSMDAWCRERLHTPLAEARRCDGSWLLRLREYDQAFPAERMVPTLEATLRGLGIDLEQQPNAHLDLDPRPLKRPRAFCSTVRIPQEVYLVILPKGGYDDYRALFHEAGHLEHFACTRPDLAFEYRWMGDNSVTEGYAFTLEHLALDEGWIAEHTGLPAADRVRYLARAHLILLFMLRRYACKVLYELELHERPDVGAEIAQRYARGFTQSLGFRYEPAEYLTDVDGGYYAAEYLRAWFFDGALTAWLRRRFGSRWWAQEGAGHELRELWSEGQRYPADVLAMRWDGATLTPAPLQERIEAALAVRA